MKMSTRGTKWGLDAPAEVRHEKSASWRDEKDVAAAAKKVLVPVKITLSRQLK
jgi:hypothetical protein